MTGRFGDRGKCDCALYLAGRSVLCGRGTALAVRGWQHRIRACLDARWFNPFERVRGCDIVNADNLERLAVENWQVQLRPVFFKRFFTQTAHSTECRKKARLGTEEWRAYNRRKQREYYWHHKTKQSKWRMRWFALLTGGPPFVNRAA